MPLREKTPKFCERFSLRGEISHFSPGPQVCLSSGIEAVSNLTSGFTYFSLYVEPCGGTTWTNSLIFKILVCSYGWMEPRSSTSPSTVSASLPKVIGFCGGGERKRRLGKSCILFRRGTVFSGNVEVLVGWR